MRLFTVLYLCGLLAVVAAWTAEDHEIFRLRDEVEASEGQGVTFYDFIGVTTAATQEEINTAYRKKSRQIHPDKARQSFEASYAKATPKKKPGTKKGKPGVTVRKRPSAKEIKEATRQAGERFAKLGIVANILRGLQRDRYDFFLQNGFPRWRGTGYYYARFRPGLTSVLLGLFVVVGGAGHYGAMYLGWKRQREFVQRYIRHARQTAWGDELGIPGVPGMTNLGIDGGTPPAADAAVGANGNATGAGAANRRHRRLQEKESRRSSKDAKAANSARNSGISTPVEAEITSCPRGTRKRVTAENGKILIVDSAGNVYLEETTAEGATHEYLLDVDEIPKPTIWQTAVFRLPVWIYNRTIGRALGKPTENVGAEFDVAEVKDEDDLIDHAKAANMNAEMRKRRAQDRIRPQG